MAEMNLIAAPLMALLSAPENQEGMVQTAQSLSKLDGHEAEGQIYEFQREGIEQLSCSRQEV